MKRKVLGVLLSVVVIGAFYCLLIDSDLCFRFFHNAVTKEIRSRNSAWFKYSKIDSLYEQKHYKYFWFVWYGNESTIDIDTVFFKKNEVLMILSDKSTLGDSIKELDMICLPESAFFYLLNEGQSTSLYHVDSIIVGDTNQYQISKYKKIY
mgnify:FL=1